MGYLKKTEVFRVNKFLTKIFMLLLRLMVLVELRLETCIELGDTSTPTLLALLGRVTFNILQGIDGGLLIDY